MVLVNAPAKRVHALEYHKDCWARLGLQPAKVGTVAGQAAARAEDEKRKKKREEDEKKRQKRNDNISYLNIAAYDMTDGRAYCVRNKRKRITGAIGGGGGGGGGEAGSDRSVIMRTRNGEITIACNKVATTTECVEQAADGRRHNASSDDDDDDSDDDDSDRDDSDDDETETRDEETSTSAVGGGGSGGHSGQSDDAMAVAPTVVQITRPAYEEDAALLTADIGALSTRDLARLHRYAIQHTQDLERAPGGSGTTRKPPAENNKKRIRRAVLEPLHRRYSCERAMQEVDMVGLVKNGMVLCVECGVMTQYRNYNTSAQGPTCMRHRQDAMQRSHPAWSGGGASHGASKKSKVHRHLLIPEHAAERVACQLCCAKGERATLYLTIYDDRTYRLQRLACCLACHTYVKTKSATVSFGSGASGTGKHQKAQVHSSREVSLYRRVLSVASGTDGTL